jgi:hypothetical protein
VFRGFGIRARARGRAHGGRHVTSAFVSRATMSDAKGDAKDPARRLKK